jgi:beta-barrel assembly-enhancing protease
MLHAFFFQFGAPHADRIFLPGARAPELCPQLGRGFRVFPKLTQAFRRRVAVGCTLVLVAVGTLAYAQCPTAAHQMGLRTQEAEWLQGKKLASQFEPFSTFITDPSITEYVNRLEGKILQNSPARRRYLVKVVSDVEVNAFSLPGGFLYVNGGLILAAENEAQLVAALAHETAHVNARHVTKIGNKRRIGRRIALVAGPAGYAVRRLFGGLFLLKLVRNAEFEADRLGLQYQYASGYDPSQFTKLLQNAFMDEQEFGFFARLLDEHPRTTARIKRAEETMVHHPQQVNYIVDTSEFHLIKERVAAKMRVANPDLPPNDDNKMER